MANYNYVINAKFNPLTMEELSRPVEQSTAAHNALLEEYSKLQTQADKWNMLAQSSTDGEAYQRYVNYRENLTNLMNDLNTNGLSSKSITDLYNARAQYAREILPMDTAYEQKRKDIDMYNQSRLQHPDYVYEKDPSMISIDEYIKNPFQTNRPVSKNSVYSKAQNFFTNIANGAEGATNAAFNRIRSFINQTNDPSLKSYFAEYLVPGHESINDVMQAIVNDSRGTDATKKLRAQKLLGIAAETILQSEGVSTWKQTNPQAYSELYETVMSAAPFMIGDDKFQLINLPTESEGSGSNGGDNTENEPLNWDFSQTSYTNAGSNDYIAELAEQKEREDFYDSDYIIDLKDEQGNRKLAYDSDTKKIYKTGETAIEEYKNLKKDLIKTAEDETNFKKIDDFYRSLYANKENDFNYWYGSEIDPVVQLESYKKYKEYAEAYPYAANQQELDLLTKNFKDFTGYDIEEALPIYEEAKGYKNMNNVIQNYYKKGQGWQKYDKNINAFMNRTDTDFLYDDNKSWDKLEGEEKLDRYNLTQQYYKNIGLIQKQAADINIGGDGSEKPKDILINALNTYGVKVTDINAKDTIDVKDLASSNIQNVKVLSSSDDGILFSIVTEDKPDARTIKIEGNQDIEGASNAIKAISDANFKILAPEDKGGLSRKDQDKNVFAYDKDSSLKDLDYASLSALIENQNNTRAGSILAKIYDSAYKAGKLKEIKRANDNESIAATVTLKFKNDKALVDSGLPNYNYCVLTFYMLDEINFTATMASTNDLMINNGQNTQKQMNRMESIMGAQYFTTRFKNLKMPETMSSKQYSQGVYID